ncbi:hypothetical protein [Cellulosilyticum sp. I15G10I2]|uniref:hypothetical protein n=1 Tax=Cellulosilyticum sp. I15G10I2 TaxID=1892843 RepID=UPI00085BCA22|nr:hypothetical protein [Cellulosilyticum sp. I15G10I2]
MEIERKEIMDFLYKYRRVIVILLASLMVGLGFFQMLTGIALSANILRGVEYTVMFGALYLLLILPKTYDAKKQKDVVESDSDLEQMQTEEKEE